LSPASLRTIIVTDRHVGMTRKGEAHEARE
jgi:hypothetical protein